MLTFFRINDPYRLIAAFVLLLVGRIVFQIFGFELTVPSLKYLLIGERLGDGFVMYKELYDYTGPLSVLVYKGLDFLFNRSFFSHQVVAFFIVCINASIFNWQLVKSKAYSENNYLPGFFYVLFSLAIPDGGGLSPMLMSSTFLLLALSNIFRRVDNEASDELFLSAGIYLGVAILFYLPALTFFFILLFSLMVFSSAIPRRLLLYIYGLTIPILLAMANYYWYDSLDYFYDQFVSTIFTLDRRFFIDWQGTVWIGAVFIFWMIISLFVLISKGRFGNYESKVIRIMLLVGLAGIISVALDVSLEPGQLHLFIPLMAFFITHYVLMIKKRIFRWVIPWLMVFSAVLNVYWIPSVIDASKLIASEQVISGVVNQDIMVISEEPEGYYLQNRIAGPVLNKELSMQHLPYLQYYETSFHIYESIATKQPAFILDESGLMDKVFDRLPLLEKEYRYAGSGRYYKKEP